MKFLVVSKKSIPAKDRTLPAWEYLRGLGHTVIVDNAVSLLRRGFSEYPDVLISMGVTVMPETFEAVKRFPKAKLFCYNWDCYEWVWTNPRPGEYDYKKYGELLSKADEIWVPSHCTGERTFQWWGLKNWKVILSSIPWWDYPDVKDEGYALCTLREIPDPYWGMFERCCEELNIPYKMTKHECTYEEYQHAVANCSFLVSPLYELSTGGLTLLEGYRLGKPCLLSNSPWHGGIDYLGSRAEYFEHTSEDHFKHMLDRMHRGLYKKSEDCVEYVENNFSDEKMIDNILDRVRKYVR